ncbi:MAG TPA: alpha/beta fold hydrolase [Thermoanaerobaculia bacterium]|nr:alpha/beta fold hydrolase [Thermoanaerobaculia bacterium]
MPTTRRIDLPPFTFWETRAGDGTPVVLLHGLGGSSDWWRQNIGVLSQRYLVSAVDLVGFGRNRFFARPSRLPLAFDEMASLLARWIESSFDGPVHLIGNSMGGQIAIHLAASRPDLVRSLVLVDSTGIPFEIAPGAHLENIVMPHGWRSFLLILTRDLFRAGPTALALAFGRLLRDDARPLMRSLTMPVLLVWGEHDPLVPLTYARQMLEEMPHAALRVIPRAGHVPMWENPRAFNETLLSFLDEREAGQGTAEPPFSWGLSGWMNGVAWRAAGRRNDADVVLIHGLGMSSAYFGPLARALHALGAHPIAPDLPGFGESIDGPPAGPEEHARILGEWADALHIRNALWIGHSLGCNAVVHLARLRPDIVKRVVCIGPLWSQRRPSRLLGALLIDAFREPFALYPYLLRAYWRSGALLWFAMFRRYASDLRNAPLDAVMIAGERDPLVDSDAIPDLQLVPGAHACHFAHPKETAEKCVGDRESGVGGRGSEHRG